MKSITLLVIVFLAIQVCVGIYYTLANFELIHFNYQYNKFIQPLYLLTDIILMIFFISLYQRQPKN